MCAEFVTCDLLDDHPQQNIAVIPPAIDGKSFKSYGGLSRYYGQVVTVKCFEDNSRVKELLASDGTGKVLIVDGGASLRCALMGDLIAESAVQNHWNGVIIYGCVRDVDAIADLDLGVHALASTPQKSTRKGVGETQVSLNIAGIEIQPNDYVYADNNGILVAKVPLIAVDPASET